MFLSSSRTVHARDSAKQMSANPTTVRASKAGVRFPSSFSMSQVSSPVLMKAEAWVIGSWMIFAMQMR